MAKIGIDYVILNALKNKEPITVKAFNDPRKQKLDALNIKYETLPSLMGQDYQELRLLFASSK